MPSPLRLDTLPFQPVPLAVKVNHEFHDDGCDTTVARLWAQKDIGRCRLCPAESCGVDGFGLCMVTYHEYVADASAALYPFGGTGDALPGRLGVH